MYACLDNVTKCLLSRRSVWSPLVFPGEGRPLATLERESQLCSLKEGRRGPVCVYVCMQCVLCVYGVYVCMHVCVLCVCVYGVYVCMHACVCACVCVCVYVCVCSHCSYVVMPASPHIPSSSTQVSHRTAGENTCNFTMNRAHIYDWCSNYYLILRPHPYQYTTSAKAYPLLAIFPSRRMLISYY